LAWNRLKIRAQVWSAKDRDQDLERDLGGRLSHRVSTKARRTKLESRCEKRREAYIKCVIRESPKLDLYLKVKRFSYDFQNLFVDIWYLDGGLEWADGSKHYKHYGNKLLLDWQRPRRFLQLDGQCQCLACRVGLLCDTTDQRIGYA